jgi:SAM-dependent methyltransferase
MDSTKDYVLGTHDEEIERLGLQHRAWRERALDAWRSAAIGPGQTVLDVGCGPGYAALDLAELVGPSGRVVGIDKSERFLRVLEASCRQSHIENIESHLTDIDAGEFPEVIADRAWCRWVFAFVRDPRALLARIAAVLKPGGVIVVHEYFDYSTWRASPRCAELEEFVRAVMVSWRDNGGEPDIALSLPRWLEELGFVVRSARPIIDIVQADQLSWSWLAAFLEVGRGRLVEMGYMSSSRAESIWQAFVEFEGGPGARTVTPDMVMPRIVTPRMITPGVLEIVAERRG